MGLIRKQAGLDMKVKIEKWISESLGSLFRYTIDDDYRVNVEDDDDSWLVIFKLASGVIEIPNYISFVFNKQIEGVFWRVNIEKIVDALNKYSHVFHNLDRLTLRNHSEWDLSENITILKFDDKITKSWVSYTSKLKLALTTE